MEEMTMEQIFESVKDDLSDETKYQIGKLVFKIDSVDFNDMEPDVDRICEISYSFLIRINKTLKISLRKTMEEFKRIEEIKKVEEENKSKVAN